MVVDISKERRCWFVTGAAGFIGSHLSDELLRHNYQVRALDSLLPQVHGPDAKRPDYLDPQVELLQESPGRSP